jgi:multicomponent Na+:H+ antiporter subunit D
MIFLFIAVPLVLASIMPLVGRVSRRFLPDALSSLAMLFMLVYSLTVGRQMVVQGTDVRRLELLGEPLGIVLAMDGFSLLMLVTIALVSFCVMLFSIDYMEHYGGKANYYALLLIMVAGMNGMVLSTDLFSLYLFLEVAAIASYGLVAYGLGHDELEASFKYLMLSAVATAFILISIAVLFGVKGTLAMGGISSGLSSPDYRYVVGICAGMFIFGFGLKAALVPFHSWLPDAHPSAPAPISAMLSGLLIKVSGIYAMTRVFLNVFGLSTGLSTVLMYLGIISIVAGALLALGQNDIKRMLAYSSISQVGYIILGIGLGTPLGILGALFHILNHALAKGLLFLNSGAIEHSTGTRALDKMGGLASKMPITAGTSVVGSLAIAGVPPLNGFWSKLLIIIGLIQAQRYGFAMVAVLASIITLWYYLLIQRRAFFGKLNEAWKGIREAPFWMSAAVIVLALCCIVIGVAFPFVLNGLMKPAADVLNAGIFHGLNLPGN